MHGQKSIKLSLTMLHFPSTTSPCLSLLFSINYFNMNCSSDNFITDKRLLAGRYRLEGLG